MQMFKLDHGWELAVPDGWIMENQEIGSYIFYPPDPEDTTTLYASVIHSEHQKMKVPEYMMQETFERSIPANAQGVSIITSVHCKAFFLFSADGTYRVGAGFFTDGELLSLNVYASSEEKVREVAAGFGQVKLERG